jgi:hypothetical protein
MLILTLVSHFHPSVKDNFAYIPDSITLILPDEASLPRYKRMGATHILYKTTTHKTILAHRVQAKVLALGANASLQVSGKVTLHATVVHRIPSVTHSPEKHLETVVKENRGARKQIDIVSLTSCVDSKGWGRAWDTIEYVESNSLRPKDRQKHRTDLQTDRKTV